MASSSLPPTLGEAHTRVGERELRTRLADEVAARKHAEQKARELEAQLRQGLKLEAIGRLAAGVAHDFNNILTVQQAYLALLLEDELLPESLGPHVRQIAVAADRAAALTRQLLLFSRRQPLLVRLVHLGEAVTQLSQMLKRILGEDIQLDVEIPPEAIAVRADAGMIDQVLMNLAVNARDAMPRGGQLSIALDVVERSAGVGDTASHDASEFARLTVQDTGSGIPLHQQAHVFEPFFTTKPVGKGTGLGLSTVYGIIQQHNGWIELSSRPNQGTTFSIFLPLAARDSATPRGATPFLRPRFGGGETLLLVEDDSAIREVVKGMMEVRGYRVLDADSGPAALEIWASKRSSIDILITDMVLPGGMTGSEVVERLRRDEPELRVIVTSGYTSEPLDELGEPDHTAFLQKPYYPTHLHALIRLLLDGETLGGG